MATQLELANRVATLCGAARIMNLSDAQKPAQAMNAVWNGVRDQCLAIANWRFAMTRFRPQTTTAPLFGWSYAYVIPADILRLVEVRDRFVGVPTLGPAISSSEPQFYELEEGRRLLTNFEPPLNCRGVKRITNEGDFDPLFNDYFVHCVAVAVWEDISRKSSTKKADIENERDRALRVARNLNGTLEPPEELPDDSWLLSRVGP